ncbi:MAG TPA: MarR family transcriptional regulator [Polyangiales bacterium]|nr:MarR family transcriptional regulator [Polyangiales bacterium]
MPTETKLQQVHGAIARLTRLTELFEQRREQLAAHVGLTASQWNVLEEISTEHFMPSMFAKSEERSRAAVSKVIRQLLDRGLIQVAISAADGRQRDYALTADGQATLAKLRAERERAIEAIWLQLNPAQLEQFNAFSSDLIERIERYARE